MKAKYTQPNVSQVYSTDCEPCLLIRLKVRMTEPFETQKETFFWKPPAQVMTTMKMKMHERVTSTLDSYSPTPRSLDASTQLVNTTREHCKPVDGTPKKEAPLAHGHTWRRLVSAGSSVIRPLSSSSLRDPKEA